MEAAVKTAGWDGDWFVRAYDAYGNAVGSHTCDEGQIFIEPQGMCVMAGIGTDDGKAVYLRIIGDLSFKEIGSILGKTENWARITFYRGKERLKEEKEYEGKQ